MIKVEAIAGLGGASLIALALVLSPALASDRKGQSRAAPSLVGRGVSSFTPAVADARLAAAFARREFRSGSFRFTPATASLDKRKAVRVAVRARSGAATQVAARTVISSGSAGIAGATDNAPAAITAVTPTAYNLGVSVGWKRFALSGDVGRVENGVVPGERKSAEVGVGYAGKKAGAKVKVAAERVEGTQRLVGVDSTYSVDLGASYSIARNLDVTGGVRYKVQQERLQPLNDARRDSQAVYIGTAFRF